MKAVLTFTIWPLLVVAGQASAQQFFTDATPGSGVEYTGESYGASWGDLNGDGLPDLFVNHHRAAPGLYLNLANGTFQDRHGEVNTWQQFPNRDQHGGSWADFDNDGDQDLIVSLGSKDPTQFLVNNGLVLSDQVSSYTFDPTPHWQGRMVSWFDFSGDGLLDFAVGTTNGPFHMFRQTLSQGVRNFVKVTGQSGNQCRDNNYGQLVDLNFDGKLEFACQSETNNFPMRIYDYSTMPFTDLTSLMPATAISNDTVFADFDGDLRQDALIVTGKVRISGAEIVAPNRIEAQIISDNGQERGMSFQATGDINVVLHWSKRNVSNTRIGSNGMNPPLPASGQPISFTLSPDDPNVVGIQPHTPSGATAVYIGYTPGSQTWQILNASGGATAGGEGEWSYVYAYVTSTGTVSNLTTSGMTAGDLPRAPVLLANPTGNPNQWVNRTSAAGLNTPVSCVSGAAADFDNDMDMDLYLVCRNAVSNAPDILYENLGGGVFAPVSGAGGAPGPVGAGVGTGETVVTADYDVDGFMDLFETNGLALYPERPFSTGGPDKLYRNVGNSNHWIELDLIGTATNRDGIGAIVTVTAGGVAQRHEQNGGVHRWSQNFRRQHFGLASNTTATVEIQWPSGTFDVFTNVSADHVYRATEGGGIEVLAVVEPPPSPCGAPTYNKATEKGVFIWKNCTTNSWQVRVTPGGASWTVYNGNLQANQNFTSVTGFSIEASDTLNVSDPSKIVYSLGVGGTGEDGFNFTFPASAAVCFSPTAPSNVPVYLGLARKQMNVPFDLGSLGPCTNLVPAVSISDVTVSEAAATASLTVSLSAASNSAVTVDYSTADGTATVGQDYVAASNSITFTPGNPLTQTVQVDLIDDALSEGNETFAVNLSNPVNATISDTMGVATITDNEISPCGTPTYNKATEQAAFIWKNCLTNTWSVRVTPGGASWIVYTGDVQANQNFTSVTGFSIEASDTLNVSDPSKIVYSLGVGGSGEDGYDFTFPGGAAVCFNRTAPSNLPVYLGAARASMTVPFDLATLGACN